MDIQSAINIKKEKLAYELAKRDPNLVTVRRLREAIRRHQKEMERYNQWKRRERKRQRK
jgi:hypothetical protein